VLLWLLLPAAFVLGLVVGRIWLAPVAVVGWLVYAIGHQDGGTLEPRIVQWLMFVSTAFVLVGSASGVLVRVVVRKMTTQRSSESP
jgi:hypothetical protein